MGLFTKENCCLCGGKTGLFDKKCLSGKVCKDCTKKLSVSLLSCDGKGDTKYNYGKRLRKEGA